MRGLQKDDLDLDRRLLQVRRAAEGHAKQMRHADAPITLEAYTHLVSWNLVIANSRKTSRMACQESGQPKNTKPLPTVR